MLSNKRLIFRKVATSCLNQSLGLELQKGNSDLRSCFTFIYCNSRVSPSDFLLIFCNTLHYASARRRKFLQKPLNRHAKRCKTAFLRKSLGSQPLRLKRSCSLLSPIFTPLRTRLSARHSKTSSQARMSSARAFTKSV